MTAWPAQPAYLPPPTAGGPAAALPGVQPYARYATLAAPTAPTLSTLVGGSTQTPTNVGICWAIVKSVGGADRLYVHAYTALYTFTLAGALLATTTLPWRASGVFAVDDDGNFYVTPQSATNVLYKIAPDGSTLWSLSFATSLRALAWTGSGAGLTLLASTATTTTTSQVVTTAGALAGTSPVFGLYCCADPVTGGLITRFGSKVYFWDGAGALVQTWGGTGLPSGQAMLGPDGALYIAGLNAGLRAYTRDGFPLGGQPNRRGFGSMHEAPALARYGGTVFFVTGAPFNVPQYVLGVPEDNFCAAALAPSQPYPGDPNAPGLGPGAVLSTPATANYFRGAQTPSVSLTLDPWWTLHSADTTLAASVRERAQVQAGTPPAPEILALPPSASAPIVLPLALPPAAPGFYVVEVTATQGGTVRSADALYYAVAPPGATLDFGALASGSDFGGPGAARNVGLCAALGFGVARMQLTMSALLSSAASTAPLDFTAYEAPITAAAAAAAAAGVLLEVQVGQGGAVEKGLAANGTWGQRVQQIVMHFKDRVYYWETWNEPNVSWVGTPATYVAQVQAPFYAAVKAADPGATVIGGTVLGNDLSYWTGIGQAGGFASMDVIGVHPYTGYNRSWEEHGWLALWASLQAIWAQYGAGALPVWITEIAWWSDNPANLFDQADNVVRLLLHARALGVAQLTYFLTEGGYNIGTSNSLIQYAGTTNPFYVKPAALALMTYKTQVGALPFVTALTPTAPHTFAHLYGPTPAGERVLVLWTDGLRLPVQVGGLGSGPVHLTEPLGAALTLASVGGTLALTIDGAPRYLRVPASGTISIAPQTPDAPNVAATSGGATLAASSAHAAAPLARLGDGADDAGGGGAFPACGVWASGVGDAQPSVTVTLARPMTVEGALLAGHSVGSVMTGVRDYDLWGQDLEGRWVLLHAGRSLFGARRARVRTAPRVLGAVRLVGRGVNAGGDAGGLRPWYWPALSSDPATTWYAPFALYEFEVCGAPAYLAAPDWSGPALPAGYAHGQRLVVTGGSDAVAGSRTTPPVLAASAAAQDYVQSVHLSGLDATRIWDTLADQAGGADLSLFWWTGTAWSQIDLQQERTTWGPWGPHTIAFRFRLQAPLGPAPAQDGNYLLAWGNASPTVLQSGANIYGFFDDFAGSAPSGSAWSTVGPAHVSVAGGVLTVATAGNDGWAHLLSSQSYGLGWAVTARAQMPYPTTGNIKPELGFRGASGFGSPVASLSDSSYGAPGGFGLREGLDSPPPNMTSPLAPGDGLWHTLAVWRDSTGAVHGAVDAQSGVFAPAGNLQSGALKLSFGVYNGGAAPYTMAADWIAVRPTITSPPTCTLAGS